MSISRGDTEMAMASIGQRIDCPASQPPIDLVRLATNTLGNRELELQILRLFSGQSVSALARLSRESDRAMRQDIIHTLKGSALAVGADAVASCCECLESDLDSGIAASLSDLRDVVDQANSYISDLLSD